ncbi:hypothetical protein Tco_0703720 [Tanacetum coccineum]|uniref:Uncharacterized protein n=1 Tax=Tanacetum coccineum TaxID=301880 RepID=A0ABQ4Y056_9ASTR
MLNSKFIMAFNAATAWRTHRCDARSRHRGPGCLAAAQRSVRGIGDKVGVPVDLELVIDYVVVPHPQLALNPQDAQAPDCNRYMIPPALWDQVHYSEERGGPAPTTVGSLLGLGSSDGILTSSWPQSVNRSIGKQWNPAVY